MSNYAKLQNVLKEIFEMDKADLDFGIYRIMNQKRQQVMDFIDNRLPSDIKTILAETQSKDSVGLQAELDKLGRSLDDAGVLRETSPKYLTLKQQVADAIDVNALEQEVFSHLASFFKRYYKDGDFVSLRRYKKDVYAIPYEGEEVKLHWANHDQYYIKTSEYLKNYAFKLSNGKKVHFQLKDASTEQNNNKTQGDVERRFAIFEELPVEVLGEELYINFTYEPQKKTVKQDDLVKEAIELIQNNIPTEFTSAFDKAPTEKNKNRTLLDKHLNNFISRNTFDFFIHKDLYGFLCRELDFYIKNEVLFLDDIATENPAFFTAQLSKIKALKTVAQKIITFLAQIEDFQKKLWLKKKFVISTNYCITLDRVPDKYYEEVLQSQGQLLEWERLFDVAVRSSNDLQNEPYLVLDTKYFSEEFTDRILSEFENLDEEIDGLLINSENFQALNLIHEKYQNKVQAIYIDPPYNTDASAIAYKNDYKDSSWLSLMENRLTISKDLISSLGVISVAIDDVEVSQLRLLLGNIFEKELGVAVVRSNPQSRKAKGKFSPVHEYGLFYSTNENGTPFSIGYNEGKLSRYPKQDQKGHYAWMNFIRAGNNDLRSDRPKLYYPIITDGSAIRIPKMEWNASLGEYDILEKIDSHEHLVYPNREVDGKLIEKNWQRGHIRVADELDEYRVRTNQDGSFSIDFKTRMDEDALPITWWDVKEYASANYGGPELENIIGTNLFSFPKAKKLVIDSLLASGLGREKSIALDFFAGSGTTGHATIKLNRRDVGKRKYILVEVGSYFNTVTKPRVQKVIFSDNWKNGKPQDKIGISQLVKYHVLESYEDTLNNLVFTEKGNGSLFSAAAQEEYLLKYMLDLESDEQLLDVQMFKNPFNYTLKVSENNELVSTKVDLVETFNYLIGLYVERIQRVKDIKLVEGKTREGKKTLVIWRNLESTTNEETERVFRKLYDGVRSSEFDQIYINGDHHFDNVRTDEEQFKVKLIEDTFFKKMFNISEL